MRHITAYTAVGEGGSDRAPNPDRSISRHPSYHRLTPDLRLCRFLGLRVRASWLRDRSCHDLELQRLANLPPPKVAQIRPLAVSSKSPS